MLTYPIIIGLQQSLVFIRHALNSERVLIMHNNTYKHSNARLLSDLIKCSVEHESLSKTNWYILSKRKRLWIKYNRMRNLHKDIKTKYGMEALQQLRLWEKSVLRESDYKNHRIFTLKCISYNLVLASVKLQVIM